MDALFFFIFFVVILLHAGSWIGKIFSQSAFGNLTLPDPDAVRQLVGLKRKQKTRRERLETIASHLERGRLIRTGYRPQVRGRFRGRKVTLTVGADANDEDSDDEAIYTATVTSDLQLDLLRGDLHGEGGAYWASDTGRSDEARAQAAQLLAQRNTDAILADLFSDLGVLQVSIRDREIEVRAPAHDFDLIPERVHRVFRGLHRLAMAGERLVTTANLEVSEATPELANQTCPYCRDSLSEGSVTACESCRTVHHAECFTEMGKCTTLGCEGKRGTAVEDDERKTIRIALDLQGCSRCGAKTRGCTRETCRASKRQRRQHAHHLRRRARSRQRA